MCKQLNTYLYLNHKNKIHLNFSVRITDECFLSQFHYFRVKSYREMMKDEWGVKTGGGSSVRENGEKGEKYVFIADN